MSPEAISALQAQFDQQAKAHVNRLKQPRYIVRPGQPCTVVEAPDGSYSRHPFAVADVFDAGILTLSFADGSERTFESEYWTRAVVFNPEGDIDYVTTNGVER